MNWLRGIWYARLRRIDLQILWPCCKKQAGDLDRARAAFAVHAFADRAWAFLGEDQIFRIVGGLK